MLSKEAKQVILKIIPTLNEAQMRWFIAKEVVSFLRKKYRAIINTYAGVLDKHARKVYGFVKLKFRSGRLARNPELSRAAAISIEPATYIQNKFDGSSIERTMQSWNQYENVRVFSNRQLSPDVVEIILDTGEMHFAPGDKLCILPKNSEHDVAMLLALLNYPQSTMIGLDDRWQAYLRNNWKIATPEIPIREFLKYCDLRNASETLINYCTGKLTEQIQQKIKINRHLHHTVAKVICQMRQHLRDLPNFSCNATAADYIGTMLEPIQSRTYSVSPSYAAALQKQLIRLVVGRHEFHDGINSYCGLASDYLINLKIGESFRIRKLFDQNFQIPQANHIPLIMFAAGTGISPFLGFIDMLNKSSEKRELYLFLSVKNASDLYYKEIIEQAVLEKDLKFAVILSRQHKKAYMWEQNTISGIEQYLATSSHHIDEMINDQKIVLRDLLARNAHVYVCGSIGFAETVSTAINSINAANLSESSDYVNNLIANNQYHVEVFSPAVNYNESRIKYPISAVLQHTRPDDYWIIINQKVYNVSEFMHIHPGGDKVIKINAGLDATFDYTKIGHSESQQINAMLLQYFIGHLKTPKLVGASEKQIFHKWLEFANAVTEMANNLSNNLDLAPSKLKHCLTKNIYSDLMQGAFEQVFKIQLRQLYRLVTDGDCNLYAPAVVRNYSEVPEPSQVEAIKELIDSVKTQAIQGLIEFEQHGDRYTKQLLSDIISNILALVNSYLENKLCQIDTQTADHAVPRILHQFQNITTKENDDSIQTVVACPFHSSLMPQ